VSWLLWAIAGSVCGTVLGTFIKFRRRQLEGKKDRK
jgi:hypothetical protein